MDLTSRQVMAFMESIRIRTHREKVFQASLNGAKLNDLLLKRDIRASEPTQKEKEMMVKRTRAKIQEKVAKARMNYGRPNN